MPLIIVMPGLDPAIHAVTIAPTIPIAPMWFHVDGRVKSGHDDLKYFCVSVR